MRRAVLTRTEVRAESLDRGEVLRLKANEKLGLTGEERQKLDAKIEDEREAIGFTGEERERGSLRLNTIKKLWFTTKEMEGGKLLWTQIQ